MCNTDLHERDEDGGEHHGGGKGRRGRGGRVFEERVRRSFAATSGTATKTPKALPLPLPLALPLAGKGQIHDPTNALGGESAILTFFGALNSKSAFPPI